MIEYSPNLKLSEPDKQFVSNCLPQEWQTQVISLSEEAKKELHIYVNAKTKEHTQKWMESYQTLTNACYSIENTKKGKGFQRKRYNCIHKTRHREKYDPNKPKSKTKNLDCPAGVTILLRNKKPTCEIKLRFYHNHSLNDSKLMKFRKVGTEINSEINSLFELGYKPATALKYLKNIVKLKFINKYTCPSYNYIYNLYTKYVVDNKIFDNDYIENWVKNLTEINDEEKYLNDLMNKAKINDKYSKLVITEDGYVICCCPPIAKRIHQFEKLSCEIIFIETLHLSNSIKMYLFLTPSEVGCLPLGITLTSSNNISTLRVGFTLFKNTLKNTPNIFVIDGNLPEEILQTIWPKSRIIISAYHTLKNLWSWLSSAENKITKDDQSLLFRDFYNILYAGNEYTFKTNYKTAFSNAKNYENFKKLLNEYQNKKELWGTCYRPANIKPHTATIKYSEVTIWFLKDMLMSHLKNVSFAHAADFTINVFFQYIKQRLVEFTNKKLRNQFYCDIKLPDESVLKKIQNIGQSLCFVPSDEENLIYAVNISLCKCTCLQDNSTSICEHIRWISKLNYSEKLYENLTNMENRKKCYVIATGQELKKWLIKEDQEVYKTRNDCYKIQIIDEEDDDDVTKNKIKLDDNFVTGVFTSVLQNQENIEMDEIDESENESNKN